MQERGAQALPTRCHGAFLSPALLLAVRINSKGREVLYLAKGDSVKLGCPYVLEPEDNGPQGVGIEWIQITPERTGPENVVSDPRPRRAPAPGGAVRLLPPSHGGAEGRRDGAGGEEKGWRWRDGGELGQEGWKRDGAGGVEESWRRKDGAGGMEEERWIKRAGVGKMEKEVGMEQAFRKKQDIRGQAGQAGQAGSGRAGEDQAGQAGLQQHRARSRQGRSRQRRSLPFSTPSGGSPCPSSPPRVPPQFLSYHDHHVNYGSGSGLQDRVAFVQNDPGQHDASIRLADLQVSDTGTYQCRVKKNTVAVHEVIVTVQGEPPGPFPDGGGSPDPPGAPGAPGGDGVPCPAEKPATPQCWTEGELIEGSSVLLRCYSRGGASPLAYQWAKLADGYGGGRLPHGTLQGGCWGL